MNWNNLELPDNPYYQDDAVVIYHADCREILPELPKVDLVLTDPPYNAGIKYSELQKDNRDDYWEWLCDRVAPCMNISEAVIIKHTSRKIREFQKIWDSQILIWIKPFSSGFPFNGLMLHWEPLHILKGKALKPIKDYIVVSSGNSNREHYTGHPAQFPELLALPIISAFTETSAIILDPFLGSGTTAYCAKKLNRKCIGIEIEEKYCEIAAKRCCQSVMNFDTLERRR